MESQKMRRIGYWLSTGLLALAFVAGGISDLLHAPALMDGMRHLGYPDYFASILGVWKLLGAAAVLAPGLPRLKEWAYAGMFFDLTGAALSHAASGDGVDKIATPLVLTLVMLASWWLRSGSRSLQPMAASRAEQGKRGSRELSTATA